MNEAYSPLPAKEKEKKKEERNVFLLWCFIQYEDDIYFAASRLRIGLLGFAGVQFKIRTCNYVGQIVGQNVPFCRSN
jgi:hypothetical protein